MDKIEQELESLTRKNGKIYTLKTDKDRFLFPEEYMKFEDMLKSKQKFSVRFLINTGARINESKHIKIEDIDLERKRIILRKTKVKARKKEKRSRPRIIPISSHFSGKSQSVLFLSLIFFLFALLTAKSIIEGANKLKKQIKELNK